MSPTLLPCLAGGAVLSALWMWFFRQRIGIARWAIPVAAVLHTVAGVLCVTLFAGLESFRLTITGGMSLYGAIFFMPLFYWGAGRLFRRDPRQVFDVMTLCMVSTLMLARLNCVVSGCCLGLPLPGSGVLRWPTREVEIAFHLAVLAVLLRRSRRQEQPGSNYPLYMMAYGIFRFAEEWFRAGDSLFSGLHPAHFWSILSVVIGFSIYTEQKRRGRRTAVRRGTRR